MIAEIGHYALILGFCFSLLLTAVPLLGAWWQDTLWMRLSRPLAMGQLVLVFAAFGALCINFLMDDFSVQYVANHSNSLMPWYYKISAVWGGHEGSLLLWILILSGWTAAVAKFSKQLPLDMVARVLGILGLVTVGFMLFILLTSNPFDRFLPNWPQDGSDLNPLLQDFGLIVHPPMLYMGYVGFSVAFAFAIAALLGGRLDAAWARWSRPWTTIAWAFLTAGIALGSWWAYYELGWGGWWFWDPVENASFMPWLAGTALMHSLAVTEKRGVFKSWTVLLAIFTFSLSLLGTFLVRSGILTSVHAFASDPERGRFILMFLLLVVGGSLMLYALRAPVVKSKIGFSEKSREIFLLLNNIVFMVATLTVLGGTLFPLGAEYFGYEVSVGAPYFNLMFAFLTPVLVLIMGVGIYSQWKDTKVKVLFKNVPVMAIVSLPVAFVVPWLLGGIEFLAVIGTFIASWLILATVMDVWQKSSSKKGRMQGFWKTTRSFKGMVLGHLGIAVTIIGVTFASHYSEEKDVRMEAGSVADLAGYQFKLLSIDAVRGPNWVSDQAHITVTNSDGNIISTLHPEKRRYVVSGEIMTEAGIDAGLFRDVYVSMGEHLGAGAWAMRVQYKPFVRWLWLGAIFMTLGGLLAIADPRYRVRVKSRIMGQSTQARDSEHAKDAQGVAATGGSAV